MCLGLPGHAPQRQTERLAGWGGTKDVVSAITWARSCIKPTPSERDEISAEDYSLKINISKRWLVEKLSFSLIVQYMTMSSFLFLMIIPLSVI